MKSIYNAFCYKIYCSMINNLGSMNILFSENDLSLMFTKSFSTEGKVIPKPLPQIPPPPSLETNEKNEADNTNMNETINPEMQRSQLHILAKLPPFMWEATNMYQPHQLIAQNFPISYNKEFQKQYHPPEDKQILISNKSQLPSADNLIKKKKIQKEKPPQLTRKIVKNYGKAIASFACSEKAQPILDKLLKNDTELKKKFISFVYENKEFIEGNRRLRHLLTISENDNNEVKRNKKILKIIAELFMKRYVQQWLWNSKLVNKELHAQLICEMRKRIKYPEQLEQLSG